MIDIEEAQKKIFYLYNTEYLKDSGGLESRSPTIGALPFYAWLEMNHPEALDFECSGDRYQKVKLWVGLP